MERVFLPLCERGDIPIPEVNVTVDGVPVDALWRDARVVVELDGNRGHRTRAQIEKDRRNDLRLRAAGYTVLRYTWDQVTEEPETGNVRVWPLAVLLRDEHLPFVGGPRDELEAPPSPD